MDIIVLDLVIPITMFSSLTALAFMSWHWQNELMKALRLRRTARLKS